MKTKGKKMMRTLLAGICALFMFSSCIQQDDYDRRGSNAGGGEAESTVTFSLNLPSSNKSNASGGDVETRSLRDVDENDVKEIDVLVFEQGTGVYAGNGVYAYKATGSGITTDGSNSRKKTFTVKLKQGNYDLVILANARNIVSAADLTGRRKWDALALLEATLPPGNKWVANFLDPLYKIPMWGDVGTTVINEQTDLTGNKAVKLTRMVARVDVQVAAAVTNFKLTSVHVYNYNTTGSLAPQSLGSQDWDTSVADAPRVVRPNVPATSTLTKGPLLYNGLAINEEKNECTSEIYIFEAENHKSGGHTTQKDLTDRTCLVIGGKYGTDTNPTYYRVDFSSKASGSSVWLDVLRNFQYKFVIGKVSGPGCDTPDEAFNSLPVNIEAEVLKWNDAEMGMTFFNEQYFMSIKPVTLTLDFDRNAETKEAGIMTDVPAGWTVTKVTQMVGGTEIEMPNNSSSWLYTDVTSGPASNTYKPLNVSVQQNNTGTTRTGYVYIKAGRLEARLFITQGTVGEVPTFAFKNYYNVANSNSTTDREVPMAGGDIRAEVNTNIAWEFKTDNSAITNKSMDTPASQADYSLSVTIPALADKWTTKETKVWVIPAGGSAQQEQIFKQTGYEIKEWSGIPDALNGQSQDVTITLKGYFPAMKFRAIDASTSTVVSNEPLCTATGSPTNMATTSNVTISVQAAPAERNVTFQYEKSPGVWVNLKTVPQAKRAYSPPTEGIEAPPYVLGVGATTGKLTLDGSQDYYGGTAGEKVYIVYFRWGSSLAVQYKSKWYTSSMTFPEAVAWVPPGYTIPGSPGSVAYATNGVFPTSYNATTGLGDPCAFGEKNGVAGGYRMPKGNPAYEQYTFGYASITTAGVWSHYPTTNSQFYPYAGGTAPQAPYQFGDTSLSAWGSWAAYQTSSSNGTSNVWALVFDRPLGNYFNDYKTWPVTTFMPVRCVLK